MSEINLIPQELKPGGTFVKLGSALKKISLLVIIVFILFLAMYYTADIFLNNKMKETLENQQQLKDQIKAMEATEQRLVLVKDRLEKINTVNKKPSAYDEIERLNIVSDLFPENSFLEEFELDEHKTAVTLSTESLDSVAEYLASVISSGEYVKVNLAFLEFKSEAGYAIGLVFPE